MTSILIPILFLVQVAAPSLDQIKTDPNLERRARLAVDFAAAAERSAEAAYTRGEMEAVTAEVKNVLSAIELAKEALDLTGRAASRNPGPYKRAELKTQEILTRLADLEKRMDADERVILQVPLKRIQEIHDAWFDGIMSRKK